MSEPTSENPPFHRAWFPACCCIYALQVNVMPCSSIPEDVWELLLIHVKLSKDQSFYIFECGKGLLKKGRERVRSVWDHRTMPWSLMVIWGISFNLFWGRLALFSHLWNENWTFLMSRVGWWVIHIKTPWGSFSKSQCLRAFDVAHWILAYLHVWSWRGKKGQETLYRMIF